MESIFNFKDQVVIITGGAMGIGEGIAAEFARCGATVIITDKNAEMGENAAQTIRNQGGKGYFYHVDVRSGEQVNAMVDDVAKRFSRIDILVNNAGMSIRLPITEMVEEQWKEVIDTNLNAAWIVCKAVIPIMIKQNRGKIINMASAAAYRALPHMAAYAASKWGIVGMTKVLATELAPYNIRVNAVAPGYCITPMTEKIRETPELYNYLVNNTPQHRFAEVMEIVGPVLFLASNAASYMTGAALNVDGGGTC